EGGEGGSSVPVARLVHLAPAVLGSAYSYYLLRRARRGAGAGEGSPGAAAGAGELPARRQRRLAAGALQGVVSRAVSRLWQAGPSRDRRQRHLPRFGVVSPEIS